MEPILLKGQPVELRLQKNVTQLCFVLWTAIWNRLAAVNLNLSGAHIVIQTESKSLAAAALTYFFVFLQFCFM